MTTWDERFRRGEYPEDPDPSPVLRGYVDTFPDGRALDVATGPGRNALLLAERGYDVDAIDRSIEGLRLARRNARDRGVDANWIRADAEEFAYPESTYDVITISFYRAVDRLADVKAALAPGGVLYYQAHLRSADSIEVGPGERYRFASNELLRACLDLTVLYYDEKTEVFEGREATTTEIVARNSTGAAQSYPPEPRPER